MKLYRYLIITICIAQGCALNDPEIIADVENYPFRLQIDEEGADLADAEDFAAEISFADYLGDLPSSQIVLNYSLVGEGDFTNVEIDEVMYEYETDECVFVREVAFDGSTITIPVDSNLGTVPEAIEVVFAFNLTGEEAEDGSFQFEVTSINSDANVLVNERSTFEYEILNNDLAGEWVMEINTAEELENFKEAFGPVSTDLVELEFADISGEVVFSFEFEEMKMEIVLQETEIVSECEDGEIEEEEENLIIEIETEYDAEEGELELEGSYFTEDGEELDFIAELEYEILSDEEVRITIMSLFDEDNFASGEKLFVGAIELLLTKD